MPTDVRASDGSGSGSRRGVLVLAGQRVRTDHVERLAELLGPGPLAAKLRRASAEGQSIIALSVAERDRILAALDDPPTPLRPLRETLRAQTRRRDEAAARRARGAGQRLTRRKTS